MKYYENKIKSYSHNLYQFDASIKIVDMQTDNLYGIYFTLGHPLSVIILEGNQSIDCEFVELWWNNNAYEISVHSIYYNKARLSSISYGEYLVSYREIPKDSNGNQITSYWLRILYIPW